ncbi:MAG: hypothetical protein GEU95_19610 [Rhizobiales bacterium]|nr:hypothetical protein [Hyphomicrobiales bacterium]
MDEINDVRICPLPDSDRWGIRYQFNDGRVHVEAVGSLANAIAAAERLRRPPTLRVIQGGRVDQPTSILLATPKTGISPLVK